jgi:hypothetical protein
VWCGVFVVVSRNTALVLLGGGVRSPFRSHSALHVSCYTTTVCTRAVGKYVLAVVLFLECSVRDVCVCVCFVVLCSSGFFSLFVFLTSSLFIMVPSFCVYVCARVCVCVRVFFGLSLLRLTSYSSCSYFPLSVCRASVSGEIRSRSRSLVVCSSSHVRECVRLCDCVRSYE